MVFGLLASLGGSITAVVADGAYEDTPVYKTAPQSMHDASFSLFRRSDTSLLAGTDDRGTTAARDHSFCLFRSAQTKTKTNVFILASAILLPSAAHAASTSLSAFAQFATRCAPHVAVETLAAVARTESGFDPLTLHDNSTGRSYHPTSRDDAIALGVELATVNRHSIDFGLMQINGTNLQRLGLSIADAFDPCHNLAAADRVLVQSYTAPIAGQDTQPALQHALSRFNTGDPGRGLANGYVSRVQASAELVVPALRVRGDTAPGPAVVVSGDTPVMAQPLPPLPPSWDVYARAKASSGQVFGALPAVVPVAVGTTPVISVSVAAAAPSAFVGPAAAQRTRIEAMNDAR